MRYFFNSSLVAVASVLALATLPAAGQTAAAFKPARLADGHPNLNGIWQAMTPAYWDLEPHAASQSAVLEAGALLAVPAGIGIVEGGTIPYKPEALKKRDENRASRMKLDPEVRCYLPGVPRATYMPYPFQIFQSTKAFTIAYEFDGAFRNVFLKDPGPAPIDTWIGQSYGKWEGDTFVVDVTGLDERTWFDRSGNYHSDTLHVVERYTLRSPEVLWYEATIDDPKTFTKSWKISFPLYKHVEPNAQLMEFKCVEFVEDLMYGQFSKKPATKE
ncbi:MAG: hypothetical protein LAO79_06110 [Acidobacteriia bacterium]|nr:hypothetical protein [Terriglobia bacterium]